MDNNSVFLGVRIADMPYSRVCFKDVNLQGSVETGLRQRAADKFNLNEKELVFVFRGRPLEGNANLEDQGVRPGATIHVMKKSCSCPEDDSAALATDQTPLSDEKLRQITSAFNRFTASRLWELSHPRVLSRIMKQYPAIRDDLGALAILRDPILLSSMKTVENFQEIAKQYPIFLQAAPAIAEILNKPEATKVVRVPEFDDSESSSSSSSSEDLTANNPNALNNNNNNNNNNENHNASGGPSRQITQRQLADALAFVGAAFRSAQSSGGSGREPMELAADPNDAEPMNVPEAAVQAPAPEAASAAVAANPSNADLRSQYAQELVQMREMGLIDEDVNLQALQICNGDLGAAINLVFSSSN